MFNFNEMNLRGPDKKDVDDTIANINRGKALKQLSLSDKKKLLKEEVLLKEESKVKKDEETLVSANTKNPSDSPATQAIDSLSQLNSNGQNKKKLASSENLALNGSIESDWKVTENCLKGDWKPVNALNGNEESSWKLADKVTGELPENCLKSDWKLPDSLSYSSLSGLQKMLTDFFYQDCRSRGEKTTSEWSIDDIARISKISIKSAKNTICELRNKAFISRYRVKNGRGGWTQYLLNDTAYSELFKIESSRKVAENYLKSDWKLAGKLADKLAEISPSSSSSLINNKKTTTTSELDEWTTIQISPVLKSLNFGEHLVKQIRDRELLNPSELQESFDAYAFDISENDLINSKKISDPVRYFMSIANKKMQYAPPGNYKGDEVKAIEENAERLEIIKKRREDLERIQQELEKETIELAYQEWWHSLSREKRLELVPEDFVTKIGNSFHNQKLRDYYEKKIRNEFSQNDTSFLS